MTERLYPTIEERIEQLKRLRNSVAALKGPKKERAHAEYRTACEQHAPVLWSWIERRMQLGKHLE